jgi:hypothetical protein
MVDRIKIGIFGRIVQGNPYKANDTDYETKQKRVFPSGHAKAGQPKISYYIALAVPKIAGHTHWAQTEWGNPIWQFGHAAWPKLIVPPGLPNAGQFARDDFSWKIEDGDSLKPNKNNRVNANTEGMPGHWIVKLSSPIAPKMIDTNFTPLMEPNAVKCGFWVEVIAQIDTNETDRNPGIYVGAEFIMLRGIDKEIHTGDTDPRAVAGFGKATLPNGVQAVGAPALANSSPSFPTPGAVPGGFPGAPGVAPPPAPVATPGTAPLPGAHVAPIAGGSAYPSSPPPPGPPATPTYVTPAPSFLNQGAAPPPPPPAPPAPPAVGRTMLPKAGGVPYEAWIANKWTDAQLREQGYMQ